MTKILLGLAAAGALAATAAAGVVWFGVYDVSATGQHLAPTYWLLDVAMRRSIARRAQDITVPPLDDEAMSGRGVALYERHCTACHGAPGVGPEPFALGMRPAPANLALTAREWTAAELYWTIRHGIKMTAMPAWQFRLTDRELWALVAFVRRLPGLSPQQYDELRARAGSPDANVEADADAGHADPARGREAIAQYACESCHRIPGIVGANAAVGPPLDGLGRRQIIAGRLPNTPANLVEWLRAPRTINPESAMPDLGVTERDARDIAAYLHTLR
jgi:mono/diheme cytochrome c family protein